MAPIIPCLPWQWSGRYCQIMLPCYAKGRCRPSRPWICPKPAQFVASRSATRDTGGHPDSVNFAVPPPQHRRHRRSAGADPAKEHPLRRPRNQSANRDHCAAAFIDLLPLEETSMSDTTVRPTPTKKRLALFLDGTWNTVSSNTNVWRLKSLCAPLGSDGIRQQVIITPGWNDHGRDNSRRRFRLRNG